jgi:hypothetical protein
MLGNYWEAERQAASQGLSSIVLVSMDHKRKSAVAEFVTSNRTLHCSSMLLRSQFNIINSQSSLVLLVTIQCCCWSQFSVVTDYSSVLPQVRIQYFYSVLLLIIILYCFWSEFSVVTHYNSMLLLITIQCCYDHNSVLLLITIQYCCWSQFGVVTHYNSVLLLITIQCCYWS